MDTACEFLALSVAFERCKFQHHEFIDKLNELFEIECVAVT